MELPRDEYGVVEAGARHFIACLLGTETPVLTAEHARHVLDVILQAYASIADGRAHEVETTFAPAGLRAPQGSYEDAWLTGVREHRAIRMWVRPLRPPIAHLDLVISDPGVGYERPR